MQQEGAGVVEGYLPSGSDSGDDVMGAAGEPELEPEHATAPPEVRPP